MISSKGRRATGGNNANQSSLVVCIAEDRRSCEAAVRLLIASLDRVCPTVPIQLFMPAPSPTFGEWLHAYPSVTLENHRFDGASSRYNVKPQAIINLLERGFDQVLWIDSDILVLSDFRSVFDTLPPKVFVTTEEALCSSHSDPDALRARSWGFAVGRTLPFAINSSVIRASPAHLDLLKRWRALLGEPAYLAAQQKAWHERPLHFLGDQEVLTAVLSSADFAHISVELLKRGSGIVQYFGSNGYTVCERLRTLFYAAPLFFHSQGYKPWIPAATMSGGNLADRFNRLYQEVTPYIIFALPYSSQLETDAWLQPRSRPAKLLYHLALKQPAMLGMPLAVVADVTRAIKQLGRIIKASRQLRPNSTRTVS